MVTKLLKKMEEDQDDIKKVVNEIMESLQQVSTIIEHHGGKPAHKSQPIWAADVRWPDLTERTTNKDFTMTGITNTPPQLSTPLTGAASSGAAHRHAR